MIAFTGTYTDQYQLTMGQAYFLRGNHQQPAIFDYFFRKLPFSGGYVVFAGLADLLAIIENWRFTNDDIAYLKTIGFHPDYLDYLSQFRFQGHIYSCREGEVVFPTMPLLRVEATMLEAQLLETMLLNILNFQSLIATKASRIRLVSGDRQLIDFGLRRAQGPGGYFASRAAMVGGFNGSSNVCVGKDYQVPVSGTMAHSFVQSYDDELTAFREFAEIWPENCVLLVDTYNTLESGIPHAIQVAKEMMAQGHQLKGIRLDSGDLAYLSKQARRMLDEAGLAHVQIAASNQLDEYVIKSLIEQQAPIDIFGVGTKLVIGDPDSALDGVYKLAYANAKPRIKLSDSLKKVTLPDRKQVYRLLDKKGQFIGADVVAIEGEEVATIETMHHPFDRDKSMDVLDYAKEPLLHKVMENGQKVDKTKAISDLADYSKIRLGQLPNEYKRFDNPHIYKVGLSTQLNDVRNELTRQHRA
ncbi:nicotinate phosphoribosyltransferase [Legionella sp. W05-934-2]|jgi:nicotinate phosphoribosyltransferase|uniref:nicotinate phosphoribosyltransferase n=1 Tax=Legionella sp. W05-934-2 TaxID=1198649 RepID=UPI0034621F03